MNKFDFSQNIVLQKADKKFTIPRVLAGPMEGIMDDAFCKTLNQLKLIEHWFTPFINVNNTVPSNRYLRQFLADFVSENTPYSAITVQLLGNDATNLAKTAERLILLGVAGINFNVGCPSLRVIKSNNGSGLLKKENLVLLKQIHDNLANICASQVPYSIKMRTGYDSGSEQKIILNELFSINDNIDYVVMHYRTATEAYRPQALSVALERLQLTRQLCANIPLVINGDITSNESAQKFINQTTADGVMVARELVKNPFIIAQLRNHNFNKKVSMEQFLQVFISYLKLNGNNEIITSRIIELVRFCCGTNSDQFKKVKNFSRHENINFVRDVVNRIF
ncbi:tRNA-dihydrouridine synthase family protein [Lentisphaerota bacterium WC36G]|nr:tRNA-dihydrouridine synthase family protein [Lentisphaerae bacterium WC36]